MTAPFDTNPMQVLCQPATDQRRIREHRDMLIALRDLQLLATVE